MSISITGGAGGVSVVAVQNVVASYQVLIPTADSEATRVLNMSPGGPVSVSLPAGTHWVTVAGLNDAGAPLPGESVTKKVTVT